MRDLDNVHAGVYRLKECCGALLDLHSLYIAIVLPYLSEGALLQCRPMLCHGWSIIKP